MNEMEQTNPDPMEVDCPEQEKSPADPAGECDASAVTEPEPCPAGEEPSADDSPEGTSEEDPADAPQTDPADREMPPDRDSDPADELAKLREEVSRLRSELRQEREDMARVGSECEEFGRLYPDVPLSGLPDDVWEDVRRGIPVSAAYALSERRRYCTAQKAVQSNEENRSRSAGAINQEPGGYYSPAEVRAMTPEQVRKNYQRIMLSMQKWKGSNG